MRRALCSFGLMALAAVLGACSDPVAFDRPGATMDDVVKCNVYLADIRAFQAMNDVFAEFFPHDPPARTTVQALLADADMLVEIEAIAYLGPP